MAKADPTKNGVLFDDPVNTIEGPVNTARERAMAVKLCHAGPVAVAILGSPHHLIDGITLAREISAINSGARCFAKITADGEE